MNRMQYLLPFISDYVNEIGAFFLTSDTLGTRGMNTLFVLSPAA